MEQGGGGRAGASLAATVLRLRHYSSSCCVCAAPGGHSLQEQAARNVRVLQPMTLRARDWVDWRASLGCALQPGSLRGEAAVKRPPPRPDCIACHIIHLSRRMSACSRAALRPPGHRPQLERAAGRQHRQRRPAASRPPAQMTAQLHDAPRDDASVRSALSCSHGVGTPVTAAADELARRRPHMQNQIRQHELKVGRPACLQAPVASPLLQIPPFRPLAFSPLPAQTPPDSG